MNNMVRKKFAEIDLMDSFFQSLRDDYDGFDNWFISKKDMDAFIQYDEDNNITGFLYLKDEYNIVSDVSPAIVADKILKIGTFKVDAHNTKLGERFIKLIMDYAIDSNSDICYVTIYPKHKSLIKLVEQFGFEYYGIKTNGNKVENVYLKKMYEVRGNINKDFPLINMSDTKKYLLSIYPRYHTRMFPDSILTTENRKIIADVSYTNSIYKVYVCSIGDVACLRHGDIVVLYRTAEDGRSAEYSSVATSICVVDEVRRQNSFNDFEEFYTYACKYSIFDKEDLRYWYNRGECIAIKLTYNTAFKKRIVRHDLINKIGLDREKYWGFFELTDEQFTQIAEIGGVSNILT